MRAQKRRASRTLSPCLCSALLFPSSSFSKPLALSVALPREFLSWFPRARAPRWLRLALLT